MKETQPIWFGDVPFEAVDPDFVIEFITHVRFADDAAPERILPVHFPDVEQQRRQSPSQFSIPLSFPVLPVEQKQPDVINDFYSSSR